MENHDDPVLRKLFSWIENVPDFYEVDSLQKERKRILQSILALRKDIDKAENAVILESDSPRSNDTRKAKLRATQQLTETLLTLEQQLAGLDIDLDVINKRISMFQSASYVFAQRNKLALKG